MEKEDKQTKLIEWDGKQKNLSEFVIDELSEEDYIDPDDTDCSCKAVYKLMRVE